MKLNLSSQRLLNLSTAAIAAGSLITTAQSNGNQLRGLASAWPAGMVTRNDVADTYGQLVLKAPNDQATPPILWSSQHQQSPNYAPSSIFSAVVGLNAADIQIDAHSTGNDYIPTVVLDGRLDPDDRWFALTVSLGKGSVGKPNSGWRNQPHDISAYVRSYYTTGSTGIDEYYVNKTLLEADRSHLGLDGANEATDDLVALDYGLGGMTYYGFDPDHAIFKTGDAYFFSVTDSWATGNSTLNFSGTAAMPVAPRGDVIYRSNFSGGQWGMPAVYMDAVKLAFDPANIDPNDVDAIAINVSQGRVIYSATKESGYDSTVAEADVSQLMIVVNNSSDAPTSAKNKGGVKLTDRMRVLDDHLGNSDELDAACGIDPEAGVFSPQVGLPVAHFDRASWGEPLGFSMVRHTVIPTGPADHITFQSTGWGSIVIPGTYRINLLRRRGGDVVASGGGTIAREDGWSVAATTMRHTSEDTGTFVIGGFPEVAHQGGAVLEEDWAYCIEVVREDGRPNARSIVNQIILAK